MCLHILSLTALTLLTGHQTGQLASRPSPSPGAGPSSISAATSSLPRADYSVADAKGFIDNQAKKIHKLERELHSTPVEIYIHLICLRPQATHTSSVLLAAKAPPASTAHLAFQSFYFSTATTHCDPPPPPYSRNTHPFTKPPFLPHLLGGQLQCSFAHPTDLPSRPATNYLLQLPTVACTLVASTHTPGTPEKRGYRSAPTFA